MLEPKRESSPRPSSDREFGLVMAGAFLIFTLVSAWKQRGWPRASLPALSLFFLCLALGLPRALAPLNFAWTRLGRFLHRVVSPVILGALYFGILTPFGALFRTVKKDPLRLELDPAAETYWIERETQPGKGMANQF